MNLDVLALSLLCCLLASVVGVLVLGGQARGGTSTEGDQDNPVVWTTLHDQTTKLYSRVQEVRRSREDILNKINFSALERENLVMESRIRDIQEKLNLANKVRAAKAEIARLKKESDDLEKKRTSPLTPQARRMLGEYKGPYVLIECVEDAALVYPGKQRIEMNSSSDQIDQLLHQVSATGFVAFVVRPEGWFDNSFDKLQKLIYEKLDTVERNTGKYIGRSTFPITSDDPITNYIPSTPKE
ncbi:MAG TPA: hypothetical protein VIW67_10875 [Terriglobales bacterium]